MTSRDLLFLGGRAQLAQALAESPRSTIVTADLAVANELEQRQIPFVDEWAHLDEATLERNWHLSYELSDAWWGSSDVVHRGVSVCRAAAGDWQFTIEAALNAADVYRAILKGSPVSRARLFLQPPQAVCRHGPGPLNRAMTSVAHAVLRHLAAQHAVPLELLPLPLDASPVRGAPPRSPQNVGAFVSGTGVDGPTEAGTVLLLDFGQSLADVAELERALRKKGGWRIARFSDVVRPGYPRWFTPSPTLRTDFAQKWDQLRAGMSAYRGPHRELFGNPFLEFQFSRIWQEMITAVEIGDTLDSLFDTLRPSVLALGVDTFTIERFIIERARARGIPSAVLIHGGLGAVHSFRSLVSTADATIVWGQEDVDRLSPFGVPASQLHRVGSIRYSSKLRTRAVEPDRARARARLGLRADAPVFGVLTGATHLGFANVGVDVPAHRNALRELIVLAGRRPEWSFIIKPHPSYDHFELYRELQRTGPSNLMVREDVTLSDVLPALDAAVLVNLCTTAGLESALAGVPVVFLRTAINSFWKRDSLVSHGAVNVTAVSSLERELQRLITMPDFRREVLVDAEFMLEHVLGPKDGDPSSRTAEVLFELARAKPAGEPPETVLDEAQRAFLNRLTTLQLDASPAQWASFVAPWATSDRSGLNSAVFGTTWLLGATLEPARLSAAIEGLRNALAAEGSSAVELTQQLVLSAFLTAMTRATNDGDWRRVRTLFLLLMRDAPREASRSRLAWRLLSKALAAESTVVAGAAEFVERSRRVIARFSARRGIKKREP